MASANHRKNRSRSAPRANRGRVQAPVQQRTGSPEYSTGVPPTAKPQIRRPMAMPRMPPQPTPYRGHLVDHARFLPTANAPHITPNVLPKHINYIFQKLLQNGGQMTFHDLDMHFSQYLTDCGHITMRPNLRSSLLEYPALFSEEQNGSEVVISAELRLCGAHTSRSGCQGDCSELHLCKWYLEGVNCKFGDAACKYGHNVASTHNAEVIKGLGLPELNIDSARALYKLSRAESAKYPPICKFYNSAAGCKHTTTSGGMTCPGMHVCLHYVKGDCSFGFKSCKRLHNILAHQPKALLLKHGINVSRSAKLVLEEVKTSLMDTDVSSTGFQGRSASLGNLGASLGDLSLAPPASVPQRPSDLSSQLAGLPGPPRAAGKAARSRTSSMSSQVSTRSQDLDDGEPAICLYHLRGRCLFGQKCRNLHAEKPYQWQFLDRTRQSWKNFDSKCNEEIELNYCDPMKEMCLSSIDENNKDTFKVNLELKRVEWMNGQSCDVRRVSTTSSVNTAPGQSYSTVWEWFWETDDKSAWEKYGAGYIETTLDVAEMEETYLENPDGIYQFATMSNEYQIKFKIMTQRNVETGRERRVRRRPQHRLAKAADGSGNAGLSQQASASTLPDHWDITDPGENSFQLVEIGKTGATASEYKMVRTRFHETLPRSEYRIIKVQRVQNLELWQGFSWKKTWMKQRNARRQPVSQAVDPDERFLFHGTRKEHVEAICQQGFDWRISGSATGTKFGKGSYFARDAKYSACYTYNSPQLFLVRVLVGSFEVGHPQFVRPPPKDPRDSSVLHDSCVDNKSNPSIFVVFEHQQSYPEYIITFKRLA